MLMVRGVELLTGVEILESIGSIAELQPSVIKARHPEQLGAILEACPKARIYTRPPTEGYYKQEIIDGYRAWEQAFAQASAGQRWDGHALGNEPNHSGGPWREDGYGWYRAELIAALFELPASHLLHLPGLVRFTNTGSWIAMYAGVQEGRPWLRRASHAYSQASGADIVAASWEQPAFLVDEFNHSGANLDDASRVQACIEAVQQWAREGQIQAAILFCHTSWKDGNGVEYAFSLEDQRRILNAVAQQQPTPQEEPTMPDDYALGQGFRDEMDRRGVTPASDQIDWNGPAGHHLGVAMDDQGSLYLYTPKTGVVVHPKA